MVQTLAPDAEFVSPLSGRMVFRGRKDLRPLLSAVYGSLRDFRWVEEVGGENIRVVVGEGRIGPLKLGDAMVFELADDGHIRRIRPHLRPWLALTLLAPRTSTRGRSPSGRCCARAPPVLTSSTLIRATGSRLASRSRCGTALSALLRLV